MRQKTLLLAVFFSYFSTAFGQSPLSVEYIMRDPAWMGTFPSNVRWSEDSQKIYFKYNSEKRPSGFTLQPRYQKSRQASKSQMV